jgi:putative MATE family efflux protein
MNAFINTQGFAKIGMTSVVIGAVINIILDPIFIFGLHMGVEGAALASIISQFFSMLWVLKFLFSNKTILKIKRKNLALSKKVVSRIISLGIAPFIMHGSESLILISLNSQLLKYGGDIAISSMTIMSSLTQIIILPLLGLTQGAQPIIGYNYGAKNIERIRKTFKILFVSCLGYTTFFVSILMIIPEHIVRIFNSNLELINVTSAAIKIYFAGIFVFGAQIACQQTFLALGKAKQSMALVILRKIVLLVPLIFILPMMFTNQYQAVLLAQPITDIISTIITVACFAIFYQKYLKSL